MTSKEKSLLERINNYRTHLFNMIDSRIANFNHDDKDIIS